MEIYERSARAEGRPVRHRAINRRWLKRESLSGCLAAALLTITLAGCVNMQSLTTRTSPSPEVPWTPPSEAQKPAVSSAPLALPPDRLSSRQNWALADLIDIGLANNRQTRAAWGAARSAAAALGIARSAYAPKLGVDLNAAETQGSAFGGKISYQYGNLTPTASLSFLLLDIGGRQAAVDEARQALAAANWTQNAVIQNVVLQIEQNYYQYLTAKALVKAQDATLKEAEANVDAAEARHRAGVATIADVLQVKTALSRARLNLISTEGLIQIARGALANSMGLPATMIFDVGDELSASLPLDQISGQVDRYVENAQSQRPDLAAARSLVLAAEAGVRNVQAAGLPILSVTGSIGRVYYSTPATSGSFNAALTLDIPLFKGFSTAYQVLRAKVAAEIARAEMEKLEEDVALQVWTSYYHVKTAAQRIKTAQDLYDAAQQSYQVAFATYKEGVGSILDLLAAQSSLEEGRVQVVQAKADWLMSLVQFARDTGTLERAGKMPAAGEPLERRQGESLR